MKKIKRILSMVLVCVMVLALVPVTTLTASAAATGTTALFNGNATYLLQERFATPASLDENGNRVLSGWDIDYRGDNRIDEMRNGAVTITSMSGGITITDTSASEKISMSHQLMKHTGALTLETVFKFTSPVDEGFYVELTGGDSVAMRVETVRKTAGGAACLFAVNGVNTSITPAVNTEYHLKAELTGSTVTVWINGEKAADNVPYKASASYIDKVELGTGEVGIAKIELKNAYVYVNYTVNENFLGKKLTGWDAANGEVVTVPGAPYSADTYGYALNPMEEVEPTYKSDDARVRIVADEASDFTWTGSDAVTVTGGHTMGDRSDVIMATGLGNGNGKTVGVVIGDSFAFEEDDVLTYSFDVYSPTAGKANVWVRNHGNDTNPFATFYHSVAANTWTTVTKKLTFAELEAAIPESSSGSFATASKYALYIRPDDTLSTLYLDNFKVTVMSADGEYYSNLATGEWLKMNETMDAPTNNVLVGSGMTPSYADGVLTSTYTVSDDNSSIVAVKVVDANGIPVTTIPAGSTIDVTVDVNSTTALSTSTTTAGIVMRGGSMTNGGIGPSGTGLTQLGKLTASANTWTAQHAIYNVTADMTTSGAWFIYVRPQQAGTLKVDNFKISIRDPEVALMAPTWEINTEGDVTWRNGGTATDADGIDGRDNVVMLSNLADNNANTAGIILGNAFAFKEGDVLKYSFDAYSTAAINPNLRLRNHGSSLSPDHTISIASIPANTWTTRTGEIEPYALNTAFGTADKFALYFRPNTSGTIYIDNFKVEVFNKNQHVLDLVTGAREQDGGVIDEAADLTEKNSSIVSDGYTVGGKSNVVKVAGSGSKAYANRAGIKFGDSNFVFREGDVLEYSISIYPTTSYILPSTVGETYYVQLRRNSSSSPLRNVAPAMTLEANKWQTITNRITFDDLTANVNNKDGNTWATAGQYSVYLGIPIEYYISDFSVKVIRPEHALGELPSNASLEKKFDSALSGSQTLEFDVLVPTGGANGFSAKLGEANFKIEGGKFYIGATEIYTPTENVWYNIKVVNDGANATAYVNGVNKGSAAAAGSITEVTFENTTGKKILIDNVQVAPTFEATDFGSEYPTINSANIPTKNTTKKLGMVSYPMWREGIHYGWDLLTPYEDRVPTLGYYTGGSQEVADWNLKWWAEHGFDHVIYPYVRPNINEAGGQPSFSVRGEELHDGYMNAINNDYVDFAIMLSNPLDGQFTNDDIAGNNATDWITNVVPYITEHYFMHPKYLSDASGNAVVYAYNLDEFAELMMYERDENYELTVPNGADGVAGITSLITALKDEAVDTQKFSGLTIIVDMYSSQTEDAEEKGYEIVNNLNNIDGVTVYKWKYTWQSDQPDGIAAGLEYDHTKKSDRVPSIPMGYDSTPWQKASVGTMNPSEITKILAETAPSDVTGPNQFVIFTCWDEWGEGHWYSPSSKAGFGYLNAVRDFYTNSGKLAYTESELPTDDAKKRMSVLYPEGRQILKIRQDFNELSKESVAGMTELGTFTPDYTYNLWQGKYGNFVCVTNATRSNDVITINYDKLFGSTVEQSTIVYEYEDIDFTKVTAIEVNGYFQNSPEVVFNMGDIKLGDKDDEYDGGDIDEDGTFRFSAPCDGQIHEEGKSYILLPDNPDKLADAKEINIIRINPSPMTADESKYKINYIKFYTGEIPGLNVYVDEEPVTLVSELRNDGTSVPAYKFLHDTGAKVTWDKSTGTLTAVKEGVTAKFTKNSSAVTVENGDDITMSAVAEYDDGNLFIPYDGILKPFGYTVELDEDGNIHYYSEEYGKTYGNTSYRWDFEIDGEREGWSALDGSDRQFVQGTGYSLTVDNGVMHFRSAGTNNRFYKNLGDGMPKENATYFSLKVDTDAPQMWLRLYDNNKYTGGIVYVIDIPPVDGPQEIVVNLKDSELDAKLEGEANNADGVAIRRWKDINSGLDETGYSFEDIDAKITKIAIDPILGRTGSAVYDYIQFTENHPNPYSLVAYSFGENIFTEYESALWRHTGTVKSNNWGEIDLTDTGDIIIQPKEGQKDGLSGITHLDTGVVLGDMVAGKKVRVSFDYKGVGDVKSLRFENRDTSQPAEGTDRYIAGERGRDGEEFTLDVTSDWQHFDGYIYVDEVTDDRRWFGIRAILNSANSDADGDGNLDSALYIRDWQIRVLDEFTEVTMFTDNGVAIKAINNVDDIVGDKVHVGAYDTANKILTGFTSGNTPNEITVKTNDTSKTEISPYYYMAPIDVTTEIRAFWWNNMVPVVDPLILQKAN